jgi:hypothetical protein
MPLESATYISDLNASNPVGSTDKVQTLDDHVRLIKSAVKATFPNITGEVTPTHTELNYVDGVTSAIQTQLNGKAASSHVHAGEDVTSGTVADARLSDNVPLLDAANVFEDVQDILAGDAGLRLFSSDELSNTEAFVAGFIRDDGGTYRKIGAEAWTWGDNDATSGYGLWNVHVTEITGGVSADKVALLLSGLRGATFFPTGFAAADLPGVDGTVRINAPAGKGQLNFRNPGGNRVSYGLSGSIEGDTSIDAVVYSESGIRMYTNGGTTPVFRISGAGEVLAAAVAHSDSETLVAGQQHFIDGNATLPNLTAGQWVQVINDSGSPITISKNGSDTTYWSTTGATVSTSFTLAARGVLTARCNPAGSAVYVTGSGITAAS